MSMSNGCQAGCKTFTGYETRHHPHCKFYPESLSKMLDDSQTKIKELEAKLAEIMGVLQEYDSGNKSCKIVSTSPTTHGIYKSANGQYCHYPTLRDKLKSAILENKS